MSFTVQESERFKMELEESLLWLYSNNIEQSEEFADQKYFELLQEINTLKNLIIKNPRMGQADDIFDIRRFPIYSGRYQVTWLVIDSQKTVILLEFIDSKYPKELRSFPLDD